MGFLSDAWDATKSVVSPITDDGVQDFLFGSEKTAKTKKTPRLTPSQMDLIKKLSGQVAGEVGQGIEPYPGQMVADPSQLQQGLFDILDNQVAGEGGTLEQMLQEGRQMTTQDEAYDQGAARDYWQQSFVEPTRQNFYEETMPELREQFAGQGALSSGGFNRAVADAAGDMETQLGGKLGEILYQGRQDFQDRQMQEQQLGLSTLDQALNEVNALMQAGQQQRGIEQQGLEAQMQKWQQSRPYNNPWLNQAPTALGASPYQIDTITQGGGSGFLGGMAPGIGQGIGGELGKMLGSSGGGIGASGTALPAGSSALFSWGMGLSDQRLKQDIIYTDYKLSGVPVVHFKWKDDPERETHTGVLAQDAQKVRPDLVEEGEDGYLRVNYDKLLKENEYGNH
jgi:hypothetical protein